MPVKLLPNFHISWVHHVITFFYHGWQITREECVQKYVLSHYFIYHIWLCIRMVWSTNVCKKFIKWPKQSSLDKFHWFNLVYAWRQKTTQWALSPASQENSSLGFSSGHLPHTSACNPHPSNKIVLFYMFRVSAVFLMQC